MLMVVTDLLNGIIFEAGNIAAVSDATAVGVLAFILPGSLYLIFGLIYIEKSMVNSYRMYYKNQKKETKDESKVVELSLISLVSFAGTIVYFIGDNFYIVEQIRHGTFLTTLNSSTKIESFEKINNIQPPFLVLGIVLYQAIPIGIKILFKSWKGDSDETAMADLNLSSSEIKGSIFYGALKIAVVTVALDSLFTVIQKNGICPGPNVIAYIWILWLIISVMYVMILLISGILGCIRLYQDNSKGKKVWVWDCVLGWIAIVGLSVAFPLYLLGDNRLPLDCYYLSSSRSDANGSILRLCFLLVALIVYALSALYLFYALLNFSKAKEVENSNNHNKEMSMNKIEHKNVF